MKKFVVIGVTAAGILGFAGSALAAHESANIFDLKATSAAAGADGAGYSIYNPDLDKWDSRVRVSGLDANSSYTFWAEGRLPDTGKYTKTAVCTLRTNGSGSGSCRAIAHDEPSLAYANIRKGTSPMATIVLGANSSTDDDNDVEDGEIERNPVA